MERLATDIESQHVLFAAGTDSLDASARAIIATTAKNIQRIIDAASSNRYDISIHVVGRADPSGAETNNLALSRRRATAVRDRLAGLGIAPVRLAVDAVGSNDPLPAATALERARLNRSASFVIQARPIAAATVRERAQ
jgi:outer membrane protein OmpA-like peptidoglycan-associated protein